MTLAAKSQTLVAMPKAAGINEFDNAKDGHERAAALFARLKQLRAPFSQSLRKAISPK
jgi:hypothetical protein